MRPADLVLAGETVFQESDSIYVGRPTGFTIGPDGSYYISDGLQGRVLRFGRDGQLMAVFGRRGRGPGEFEGLARLVVVDDTLLIAMDALRQHVKMFHIPTGRHLSDVYYEGDAGNLVGRGDTIWMSTADREREMSVATWTVHSPDMKYLVGYPTAYRGGSVISSYFRAIDVLPLGDSLLVTFHGSPEAQLTDLEGRLGREVRVPAVRRRGVPDDLEQRYQATRSQVERVRLASLPASSQRLSTGEVALVHFDIDMPAMLPLRTGFVSLLSADLGTACVDAPLPLSKDGMAQVAFRGDTLVTIEQEVEDLGVRLLSRSYVIDHTPCQWMPVQ